MASHMEWHLPVQEEADWLRLLLFENEVRSIAKAVTQMQLTSLAPLYPTAGSACPSIDCLATSNGICTKRNMAQFGLLLFENEVNNNSQI